MASMAVVNGPIRHEIAMNAGTGAMGPYSHANATIGRAYGLLSQNGQGGSVPGLSYMGNQGNSYAYNSVTFAENEERSPWEPFHVQQGFPASESAVSVFSGCRSTAFALGLRETHWREHVRNLLRGMDPSIPPTLLLDPIAARQFVDRGGFVKKAGAHRLAVRHRPDAGARVLGLSARPELHLPPRHVRRGAVGVQAPRRARRK